MAIITTQSTTINDPSTPSGKADLSVKYIKNLKVLLSKRVALINATIENREQLDAGTAIYNITKRNITEDYKAGAGANNQTAMNTIQILLDKKKEINFEEETLDLKRLGARYEDGNVLVSDSLASSWIDAKAKSVEIYLVPKLLSLAVKTAKDNGIINIALPSNPKIDDYRMLLWLKISNTLATLKARINDEYIGTDEEDYVLWVSSFFKPLVLLSTTTLGSDSASQALKDGKIVEIGGIKIVECPWLGRNYPAGVIDKQEGFNYLGCDAVLVHKEALAFPFNRGQDNTFVLQTNGNVRNFHKFLVSEGKALRPDLVKGFTVTSSIDIATAIEFTNLGAITMAGAEPTADEVEKAVIAKNPNYVKGNANFSNLTATSATATGKSLYDGEIQVTFTKR
ncbi:hypothetical protein [Spiroplasma ixodetis]|uniref:hypothetical protein n=1 Tax=Spiroplasma ixodetis TaxID=2141 RepID=UPI002578BEF0|nr:hypothetical protein [Spiroplasma ixodetis]WJG70207.1 hypothetical protein SIXOD_v1c12810 [Spiroplasma ixodetis Y32]